MSIIGSFMHLSGREAWNFSTALAAKTAENGQDPLILNEPTEGGKTARLCVLVLSVERAGSPLGTRPIVTSDLLNRPVY